MILKLVLALGPVGIILILSEVLWRKKLIVGERARKFIHVLAGSWIAFWPLYIPFDGIFILGCAALTLLIYSRLTHLFHAIYAVKRKTYGDIWYALAIIVCAFLGSADWIFTASILFLCLADGGAAVAGKLWGRNTQYRVFGRAELQKSVHGTLTFLIFCYFAIGVAWFIGDRKLIAQNILVVFGVLPFASTILENISPRGIDNLVTPLFVTLLLNSLL